ncbi:hypothetical protein PINS_up009558 [Pythium insidiosum]|nr:hypothetical protein PINS_up009558 [Pythium insidiosum]
MCSPSSPPLLSFGLITDVQYADVEDGWNYSHTTQRFYRNAFVLMERAIDAWLSRSQPPLAFAVNLGDLIDGKSKRAGSTPAALERMQRAWRRFETAAGPTYYDFTVDRAPGVRFVVLNPYGVTSLARAPDDPVFQQARATLRRENPNDDLNSPLGLRGKRKRFVEYNGAVDAAQLEWLHEALRRADAASERVVVFSHVPLHPSSCPATCLLWNYDAVLRVIDAHDCVRAVFSGHVHSNGYHRSRRGVHFVVCDAVLECRADENAYATVDVHHDRLVVRGHGKIPSRELRFE